MSNKTEILEQAKKEIKEIQQNSPEKVETAKKIIQKWIVAEPEFGKNKELVLLSVYSVLKLGEQPTLSMMSRAFKQYDEKITGILQIPQKTTATAMNLLSAKIVNELNRMNMAKTVYVLSKTKPRETKWIDKESGAEKVGKVMNLTIWVEDSKTITNLSIWNDEIPIYDVMKEETGYKLPLNTDGVRFFTTKNPVIVEIPNYKINQKEIIQHITEVYPPLREPLDQTAGNRKLYYTVGDVSKKASGGFDFFSPELSESFYIPATGKVNDGDQVLVLTTINKPKARENSPMPDMDYIFYPTLILSLNNNGQKNGSQTQTSQMESSKPEDDGLSDSDTDEDIF